MKFPVKIFCACLASIVIGTSGFSQQNNSIVSFNNPLNVATPRGYSHAAVIDLGTCKMLVLSGQIAIDSKGDLVGKGDVGKQTEQVFRNIRHIVTSLGGTMDQIIKLGVFMIDVSQVQAFRKARDKFINTKNPPASSLVQVSKLVRDEFLIEIEATVIIPKK